MADEDDNYDCYMKECSLLSASETVKDLSSAEQASTSQNFSLKDTISIAEKLKDSGIENRGSPFESLECMTDFFTQNPKLNPILANMDSSRNVDRNKMGQFLWHSFSKRAASSHSIVVKKTDEPKKNQNCNVFFSETPSEAWTNIKDLPIFFANEEEDQQSDNGVEKEIDGLLNSQSMMESDEKISVPEFLEECRNSQSGVFTPEFLSRLCVQSEAHLAMLLASCCNSDLYIPLLLDSAKEQVKLIRPLCEKILLPLSKRNNFDTTIIGKTCLLIITFPMLMSAHLLVPLVQEYVGGENLAIKLTNLCENEDVKHTLLTCLLNSDWTAKKTDLDLLQCLLGSTVPKDPVVVQLLCQMFKNADTDLKSSPDFAKLLLQTIKVIRSDLNAECRELLRAAIAEVKLPLRSLMEKQLQ
ncbi:uncharacterized protein LOC132204554 [Neocloeon triangulifer]|uniref:uncharacterized protein LOC132204554 n=1 Tax=Neocloeon triangulifer TaxID=2078957 RepID=UPI00286EB5F3|nr:uncharacterized protein LOC132204554 [Neocloeon triangulifer]